ncbi:MAG: TIGR03643 family protein [Bdellovibrionales bacterium]|nr:TIGR03643 family protein [Bdellovibrionales bacterium]
MGISRKTKDDWAELSAEDQDRIVRMAWEDRTSFEAIQRQFGLTPNQVERFMRTQLDEKAYRRWRKRASERGHLKQGRLRPESVDRFKCTRQRSDGSTKGWK